MSAPFSYLLDRYNASESGGSATSNRMDLRDSTPATLTDGDGDSTYDGIDTPRTTDGGIDTSISDLVGIGIQGTPASRVALPELAGMMSAPEPTVLLNQIQHAAEDVSQLVGRFGSKMILTVQRNLIKQALFADRKLLQLPCLAYADNFTCQVTKLYGKQVNCSGSAPLLWWLWNELLDHLKPSATSRGCHLKFEAVRVTDIELPYTISLNLTYKRNKDCIELSASYGGQFYELRTFDASVDRFCFPETKRYYSKSTTATLNVDEHAYKGEGCLNDTLDYLMPRQGSIWRYAMNAFPPQKEEDLVIALVGTCKAEDDLYYMSENQAQQCLNLLKRFPPDARAFITNEKLVGKTKGPYSKMANRPAGPKD